MMFFVMTAGICFGVVVLSIIGIILIDIAKFLSGIGKKLKKKGVES